MAVSHTLPLVSFVLPYKTFLRPLIVSIITGILLIRIVDQAGSQKQHYLLMIKHEEEMKKLAIILGFLIIPNWAFGEGGFVRQVTDVCPSASYFEKHFEEILKKHYSHKISPKCIEIDGGYRFYKIFKKTGGEKTKIQKGKKTGIECKTAFQKNCFYNEKKREYYLIEYLNSKY